MLDCRAGHRLAVLHRQLWAVGGFDNNDTLRSCEHLDEMSSAWVRGPDMTTDRHDFGVVVLNGELWIVGGNDGVNFDDTHANAWTPSPAHGFLGPTCSRHAVTIALLCYMGNCGPSVAVMKPTARIR